MDQRRSCHTAPMSGPSVSATGRWESLVADFSGARVVGTITSGVILGMVNALLVIALMSLIFQGENTDILPLGMGLGLLASAAVGVIVALGSDIAGAFAGVQDSSAAILGLATSSIALSVATPQAKDTVIATMVVASIATGATLLLMARFRLGDLARFVPFPVVGGLLAGTGYLIVAGSVEILGGLTSTTLSRADGLAVLVPGFVLAASFLVASRLSWPPRSYLILLVLAIGGFHTLSFALGMDRSDIADRGWLLGPFPKGSLIPDLALDSLGNADWAAIGAQAGSLATILLVIPMTVLLYVSALEVEMRRDLDVGQELRVTGWANVAGGLLGGPPGYLYLADTLVIRRLFGGRRGSAVVASAGLLLVVVVGGALLGLVPQFLIGGLLLFVGLEFLMEWLWDARHRMNRLDYVLMLGIVTIIATVGFLPGVGTGLLAAIVLFVVRYSKVDVVRHMLTMREQRSNIERAPAEAGYLDQVGDSIVILELQGFVFFGTAHRIISQVRTIPAENLECIVCDFRMVTGIDSSALILFERLALLGDEHEFMIVLTGLSEQQDTQFSDLIAAFGNTVRVEPDLDRGLAWCEEKLIEKTAGKLPAHDRALPDSLVERLSGYLEPLSVAPGTVLMRQGDPAPGLYLIIDGRATVLLDTKDGPTVRLRTLLGGTLLGEMSLYNNQPVTASVVSDTECRLLHMSPESFREMCEREPALAADFHEFVARTLAARVSFANRTIRALQR